MSAKCWACVLAACAALTSTAAAVTESVQCRFNYAPAEPCRMTDHVGADGVHNMEFVSRMHHARFVGRSQTGWWSGQLDGRPAMGYELNRGNVVFSTVDLQMTFQWWSQGNQHGNY